ncbi:acyl carrier protein [Sphingobium sp. AN558]|uniref:acyl carrier protein n=1 Tax=Sphingobium sp. AN558 TaxID=3133442 RepID=UPI0030C612D7
MSNDNIKIASPVEIESWIVGRIAELVNVPADTVSPEADFESFGIDSAKAIALIVDLENWLDLPDELPLELLFEAGSIGQAAENIAAASRAMVASQAAGAK